MMERTGETLVALARCALESVAINLAIVQRRSPMRAILSLSTVALLFVSPVLSQETTGKELAKDPAVQDSQQPHPTEQGVRSPTPETSSETASMTLQQALAAVLQAPPDLQGKPVPRPNAWASNPDDPQEPTRSTNPSDLSSKEVK
jgi:hypothetical protein